MNSSTCSIISLLIFASVFFFHSSNGETYEVGKVTFKSTYVENDEKIARIRISAKDETSLKQIGQQDDIFLSSSDSIAVQAAVKDMKTGSSVVIEQSMLRFINKRTGKDNIYLMRKSGNDLKLELNLKKEIRSDRKFWNVNDKFQIEIIFGDNNLKPNNGFTWVVATNMNWNDKDSQVFKDVPRNVFDFDVSVKKDILLPEFEFPLPELQKRAHQTKVIFALLGVIIPLPILLFTWFKMGVFPLNLPKDSKQFMIVFGLHLCILAHIIALTMFWVKWNIVTTWKVMGTIMIPTSMFIKLFVAGNDDK